MKLCKDCKFNGGVAKEVCIRPIPTKGIDYVFGLTTTKLCRSAQTERIEDYPHTCGPNAKFFESTIKADDTHQADVPLVQAFVTADVYCNAAGRPIETLDTCECSYCKSCRAVLTHEKFNLMDIAHNPDPRD